MLDTVRKVVVTCQECDRVKTSFSVKTPQLHPLPIRGMFYRWSLDLAGELPETERGYKYVLVMIEHFSKWIILVPLKEKRSAKIRDAFMYHVLSVFGACVEVLTDQGTEFQGDFQELLEESFIDHRVTSRDHPQADGLAERMVQTCKSALRKYVLTRNKTNWDRMLPFLAMGYRMSRQASLGRFSPYMLLFGRTSLLDGRLGDHFGQLSNLDSPDEWLRVVEQRAYFFKTAMPMAMNNLLIAQHGDTL